jgi:hypothetical protein
LSSIDRFLPDPDVRERHEITRPGARGRDMQTKVKPEP